MNCFRQGDDPLIKDVPAQHPGEITVVARRGAAFEKDHFGYR